VLQQDESEEGFPLFPIEGGSYPWGPKKGEKMIKQKSGGRGKEASSHQQRLKRWSLMSVLKTRRTGKKIGKKGDILREQAQREMGKEEF